MNSGGILGQFTCGVYIWGDSQEHGASIWRKSLLDFLKEIIAVKTPCSVRNGSHACLTFHTWYETQR